MEIIDFVEINEDQRRERVNTEQRFAAFREARRRYDGYRGSLSWRQVGAETYLTRSYYDTAGRRRQASEGRRSPQTERVMADWHLAREEAALRQSTLRQGLDRQAAVNRALGLGRVPLLTARIARAIDAAGLLGRGLRVAGTNAIYAYEAVCGVAVDASVTSTQDIDLLMDARRALRIVAQDDLPDRTLLDVLRRTDRSFRRAQQTYSAVNRDGFLVDLIKPQPRPPWRSEREAVGGVGDLVAAPLDGLPWLQSAPTFEAVAIDEKGEPLRLVAVDPRVFAAHKLWLSTRDDRAPVKRRRDAAQARVVGALVARYLLHLPYEAEALRMLPRPVFEAARPLFDVGIV